MINHVVTLVSGKRYVLAGIVDCGLEGGGVNQYTEPRRIQLHRPRDNFPCPQYSYGISLFFIQPGSLQPHSQKFVNESYLERDKWSSHTRTFISC